MHLSEPGQSTFVLGGLILNVNQWDTDPSGGDERVELYGQEGRGSGGWLKERGDEAGKRDVGEVLQYWVLEKPFPYGVHPTVKKKKKIIIINI